MIYTKAGAPEPNLTVMGPPPLVDKMCLHRTRHRQEQWVTHDRLTVTIHIRKLMYAPKMAEPYAFTSGSGNNATKAGAPEQTGRMIYTKAGAPEQAGPTIHTKAGAPEQAGPMIHTKAGAPDKAGQMIHTKAGAEKLS